MKEYTWENKKTNNGFRYYIWDATEFKDLKEMKKYLNAENWGLRRKAFEFMNYYSGEFRNCSLEIPF